MSNILWAHELQHIRLPCPSLSSRVCSDSCPLNWWCYLTISFSAAVISSCPQSFPASGLSPMSWLSVPGGQSIGVSASASVLPVNIQDWFPLGWIGLISLQSKGLSRVFSNTAVQKYQFFSTQHFTLAELINPYFLRTGRAAAQVALTIPTPLSPSSPSPFSFSTHITCEI